MGYREAKEDGVRTGEMKFSNCFTHRVTAVAGKLSLETMSVVTSTPARTAKHRIRLPDS